MPFTPRQPFDSTCTTFLFYGTLMAPSVLSRVTSHSVLHPRSPLSAPRPGLLRQHRRHRVKDADYPAVAPSSDAEASVRGVVVSGFKSSDVFRLDTFEGSEYVRSKVKVVLLDDGDAIDEVPGVGVPGATATSTAQILGDNSNSNATAAGSITHLPAGTEIDAYTYIWCSSPSELEDKEWDFDEFVREKMWRWAGGQGDSGFEDVAKLAEEHEAQSSGVGRDDPTRGRSVNGGFESAVSAGDEAVVRSAV